MKILLLLSTIGALTLFIFTRTSMEFNLSTHKRDNKTYRGPSSLKNVTKLSTQKSVIEKSISLKPFERIHELLKCWDNECSQYSSDDPKEYYFLLGDKLALEVSNLNIDQIQNESDISELLNIFKIENAFVREKVLDLIQQLPPDEKIKELLTQSLTDNFEAKIVYQTLIELLIKYPDDPKVLQKVEQLILSGPHFSRVYFLERLSPLIDERTFAFFKNLLPKLNFNSQEYKLLKFAVNEYSLHVQGA
ncbi:MAG: hypothetical protein H6622_06460 [Halobacteriovoraceae bacterium]|nr:hypothetical protein [Halobacteriovoraceae bacterium]